MKRRYFSFIAVILVFIMLIFTAGCGVRINGKDYLLFDSKNKVNSGILNGIGSESSRGQEVSEERQDAEKLSLSSNVGEITLRKSNDSKIAIKATKKVKGTTEKSKNEILDNMNVQIERTGKVLNVEVKTKDGNDFWIWQKSSFKGFSPTVDFEISVPEGINEIQLESGVGDIKVSQIKSELSLKTGVGEITVQDVSATGDVVLKTGTGDISFEGNVDGVSSFEANTGVGDIGFIVPESTKMSLNASTGVGSLSGSFIKSTADLKLKFQGDINGGGPSIKLKTGVGDIRADNT